METERHFPTYEYALLNAWEWLTGFTPTDEQLDLFGKFVDWDRAERICEVCYELDRGDI